MAEKVLIDAQKLKELVARDLELSGLKGAGVDNWQGWDEWERPTDEEIQAEFDLLTKD